MVLLCLTTFVTRREARLLYMTVAAVAMPPVAEKTSGAKELFSISRTHCSFACVLRDTWQAQMKTILSLDDHQLADLALRYAQQLNGETDKSFLCQRFSSSSYKRMVIYFGF